MQTKITPLRDNHLQTFTKLLTDCRKLRIISPFITRKMTTLTLDTLKKINLKVITRYNLNDFYQKVSDIGALRMLLDENVEIRGVKRLHSKLYIFDDKSAIVSSANFTSGGMEHNYEFGLLINSQSIVKECISYFNFLWERSNNSLTVRRLNKWEKEINKVKSTKSPKSPESSLTDEGANCLEEDEIQEQENAFNESFKAKPNKRRIKKGQQRYFVKIFGSSENRVLADESVREEVKRAECHYAVCYPKKKRPGQVRDDDIIYMCRILKRRDYAIFGKAVGMKHLDKYDIASPAEIKRTWLKKKKYYWKDEYPNYIRVNSAAFIDTIFKNCPMLKRDLFGKFNEWSLVSTMQHKMKGSGNINPVKSLGQKAAIEITEEAALWLDNELQSRFDEFGTIPKKFIDKLPKSKRNLNK